MFVCPRVCLSAFVYFSYVAELVERCLLIIKNNNWKYDINNENISFSINNLGNKLY